MESGRIYQKTPDTFMTEESLAAQDIVCGVAETPEDRRKRLELVTERYLEVGYIDRNDPRIVDGVFIDPYEIGSIPIVAKIGNEVVGSLRLIQNSPDKPLPMVVEDGITVYPEWEEVVKNSPFEWSQLVKSRSSKDSRPLYALIRAAFAATRESGSKEGVAVIDTKVKRYLNGARTSFSLPAIGEPVDYMGSLSTPIFIDFESVIRSCAAAGKEELSIFLNKGAARGFEWYKGA